MAFQIKDFPSIAAGMLNRARASTTRITDFNIGSVFRTIIESVAVEIDQLYQQFFNGLKEGIPVAVYNSFNFYLLSAIPASGQVTVTIASSTQATLIPAGTSFTPPGSKYSYLSIADVVIAAGNTTAAVSAAASIGGLATNLPASVSFTMNPQPSGFVSAINATAWINGTDDETEDQRKIRFNDFIQALARGTVSAIGYGAKLAAIKNANGVITEQVKLVQVYEPYADDNTQPIGLVRVYIHNGIGSTSVALVAEANKVIYGYYDSNGVAVPGWKAAGAHVDVIAATEDATNIVGVVTPKAGYDGPTLNTQVQAAITAYQLSLDIRKPFQRAQAIVLAKSVIGVDNFVLSTPAADVTAAIGHKIMPGTYTLTN